jgi:hypothetical protein
MSADEDVSPRGRATEIAHLSRQRTASNGVFMLRLETASRTPLRK